MWRIYKHHSLGAREGFGLVPVKCLMCLFLNFHCPVLQVLLLNALLALLFWCGLFLYCVLLIKMFYILLNFGDCKVPDCHIPRIVCHNFLFDGIIFNAILAYIIYYLTLTKGGTDNGKKDCDIFL